MSRPRGIQSPCADISPYEPLPCIDNTELQDIINFQCISDCDHFCIECMTLYSKGCWGILFDISMALKMH
jgi:hypothetical protein